jgi:hypothetical protein
LRWNNSTRQITSNPQRNVRCMNRGEHIAKISGDHRCVDLQWHREVSAMASADADGQRMRPCHLIEWATGNGVHACAEIRSCDAPLKPSDISRDMSVGRHGSKSYRPTKGLSTFDPRHPGPTSWRFALRSHPTECGDFVHGMPQMAERLMNHQMPFEAICWSR